MKPGSLVSLLLAVGLSAVAACGDDDEDVDAVVVTPPPGDGTPDEDVAARDAQIERGMEEYSEYCASCHGDVGQGTNLAPPLVGPGALPLEPRPEQEVRDVLFVTADDVYEFARVNMPLNEPGSLEDEEYLDIVAFAMDANGHEWTGALAEDELENIVINEGPSLP